MQISNCNYAQRQLLVSKVGELVIEIGVSRTDHCLNLSISLRASLL